MVKLSPGTKGFVVSVVLFDGLGLSFFLHDENSVVRMQAEHVANRIYLKVFTTYNIDQDQNSQIEMGGAIRLFT